VRTRAPSSAPSKAATQVGGKERAPSPRSTSSITEPEAETAPRPTVERAARLGINPSQIAAGLAKPVQRKFGFEAELSVPTMGPKPAAANARFKPGKKGAKPDPVIEQFLTGGLDYDRTNKSTDPNFRLTADHNVLAKVGEDVKQELVQIGALEGVFGKQVSNLEYSTDAVDELKPGANAEIEQQIDAVAFHVGTVTADADSVVSQVAKAPGVFAGFPQYELMTWLDGGLWEKVPSLAKMKGEIHDSLYLQVTAGILPSAIPGIFSMAGPDGGGILFDQGDVVSKIQERVDGLFGQQAFVASEYFKSLTPVSQESLKGIIYLIFGYMVADAIWQTTLIPDGTSGKNTFLFLPQMQPENFANAAPGLHFHADDEYGPPQGFAKFVSNFLLASPYVKPQTWAGEFNGQVKADRDHVVEHPYDKIVKKVMNGEEVKTVSPHDMQGDVQQPAVQEASENQMGVPLELRTINAHPQPGELKSALLAILEQVQLLNTQHMDGPAAQALIAAAKAKPQQDNQANANANNAAADNDDPFAALGDPLQ
jgi:hypothetical protein